MLAIRFNRIGKRNKSCYRIVLQEHTIAPGGRHIAILGSYDPHLKKAVLKAEKIKEWIGKGAQASDSAYNLFVKEGVIEGKKRIVKIPKKKEEAAPAEADKKAASENKEDKKEKAHKEGSKPETKSEEKVKKNKTEEPKAEEVDKK